MCSLAGYNNNQGPKLSSSQELKVEDFIINGRPGKASDFLHAVYDNKVSSPITDEKGDFLPEIMESFVKLHPNKDSVPPDTDNLSSSTTFPILGQSLHIPGILFEDIINHLPLRSSNGLSAWSNDLLRFIVNFNLTDDEHSPLFISLLTLVNFFLDGKVGLSVALINVTSFY